MARTRPARSGCTSAAASRSRAGAPSTAGRSSQSDARRGATSSSFRHRRFVTNPGRRRAHDLGVASGDRTGTRPATGAATVGPPRIAVAVILLLAIALGVISVAANPASILTLLMAAL